MMFVTGMEEEPVLGFGVEPSLCFNDVDKVSGFYPTANTCINRLKIPRPTLEVPLPTEKDLVNIYDWAFSNIEFSVM